LLTASALDNDTNKPSLRPGIYLLKVKSIPNLGLVIHWPEIGCYENALNDSQIKRNMINLHRCDSFLFFALKNLRLYN
jgi:hypothetical protein